MSIKLFWWTLGREDGKDNFGDILSKYIVEKISLKKVAKVPHPSMRRYKYFFKHYLAIGSILEVANTNSIIWGSGIIRENQFVKKAKFLAVRGPRTRKRLLELGYKVPQVYGDPGILISDIFPENTQKRYELGIIPHYVNYEEVKSKFKNDKRVCIIDLMTDNVEKTLLEIQQCKSIISSSLHGVIISQSYKIPSLWVQFSEKLAGDNVKFYDYFESVGISYSQEFSINDTDFNYEHMSALLKENTSIVLPNHEDFSNCKKNLINSCPFNAIF